jgi:Zn-dependent protease
VAYRFGDPTAKNMGRLTLNPLPHLDPFGSVLLPLLLLLSGSPLVFGMAKPVPINPYFFRDFRRGLRYVGLGGPLANILVALIVGNLLGLAINILANFSNLGPAAQIINILYQMIIAAVSINIFLALFNLIPIPPLDGSRIVASFLSYHDMERYFSVERYGILIIFGLFFFFSPIFWAIISPFFNLLSTASTLWRFFL